MSDNVCPKCGNRKDSYACQCNSYTAYCGIMLTQAEYDAMQSEIARLKVELEKAEVKIVDLGANLDVNRAIAKQYSEQRDEARKWARYFYWMWRLIK